MAGIFTTALLRCHEARYFRQSNLACHLVKHNKGNICSAKYLMILLEVAGFSFQLELFEVGQDSLKARAQTVLLFQ